MEKLIELLSEYDPYIASDGEHRDNIWGYAYQGHSAIFPKELAESYIISASYGFIKWLVENDKIDYEKLHGEKWYLPLVDMVEFDGGKRLEVLLMLLSIQDNPIQFLVSILK